MQPEPPAPSGVIAGAASPPDERDERLRADEQALLEAVLRKDRKATAEFVSRYADPVYAYLRQRLAPRTDRVDDLMQDVFLAALQKLDSFGGQSSVVAWLIGIARHKVEDHYRTKLREPETLSALEVDSRSGPVTHPDFDDLIDRTRAQEKTRRVLERLPEQHGLVLVWRYWERRSTREMAAATGRTEKAIERLLARARAEFRRLWEAGERHD